MGTDKGCRSVTGWCRFDHLERWRDWATLFGFGWRAALRLEVGVDTSWTLRFLLCRCLQSWVEAGSRSDFELCSTLN